MLKDFSREVILNSESRKKDKKETEKKNGHSSFVKNRKTIFWKINEANGRHSLSKNPTIRILQYRLSEVLDFSHILSSCPL